MAEETAAERREADLLLEQLNQLWEPYFQETWEAALALQHMSLNGRWQDSQQQWCFE